MPIVPDDEQCIQQMLGILEIPPEIEQEYMIRARMLHRQLAGGPIGPIAIVDMLRCLDFGPPPALILNEDGRADWRRAVVGTPVEIRDSEGNWLSGQEITFAGEVGSGTLAVNNFGRIDELNAFDVRIPEPTLPSDVDAESFEGEVEREEGDARAKLIKVIASEEDAEIIRNAKDGEWVPLDKDGKMVSITDRMAGNLDALSGLGSPEDADEETTDTESEENEVETKPPKGDIGGGDEVPQNIEARVNWGQVKKKTEVLYREGEDMHDATFHRCVAPDKALILVDGEEEPREVERAFLKLP